MVLGASIMDTPERLEDFSKKYGLTYPQWRDPDMAALDQLTVQGVIPRTVVLDRQHRIVLRELGYTEEKFEEVVAAVQTALGRAPAERPLSDAGAARATGAGTLAYSVLRRETLASEDSVGFFTSVAVDAAGRPAVACKDYSRGALLVATWTGEEWRKDYVDERSAGWSPSIAFDPEGNPGVSYGSGTEQFEVRYAHRSAGAWKVEVVDDRGNPFKATSLVYTKTGDPLISYFARDDQDLRLARWSAREDRWLVETVDAEGDVGTYTSLALDSHDNPMIAYYDEGLQVLKFARREGQSWDLQVVDSEGQVGMHCSLAFDHGGHPAIAYFDLSNEDLKVARWTGSAWELDVVDEQGTVGQRCSLEFDSRGNPVISYFGNGTLKLASLVESTWRTLTVDDSGLTGNYTSLALDADDNAYISYFDVSGADLEFAWVAPVEPE